MLLLLHALVSSGAMLRGLAVPATLLLSSAVQAFRE